MAAWLGKNTLATLQAFLSASFFAASPDLRLKVATLAGDLPTCQHHSILALAQSSNHHSSS